MKSIVSWLLQHCHAPYPRCLRKKQDISRDVLREQQPRPVRNPVKAAALPVSFREWSPSRSVSPLPARMKRKLYSNQNAWSGEGLMSSRASFKRLGDTKTVSLGLPSCFRDDTMNSRAKVPLRGVLRKSALEREFFCKGIPVGPEFLVFRVSGV